MKELLLILTVIAFFLTMVFGKTFWDSYIPPFKEGACIEMDVRYMSEATPDKDSQPYIVFGSVSKNNMPSGSSLVVMVYKISPGVYLRSIEQVLFVDLRRSGAVEVPCG